MSAALRFAPLILLGVLIAVLAVALLRPDSPEPPQSRLTGQPLPALELQRLDGKPGFDLTQAEGPYLLNIWGSWCPPCRIEHPVLMDLAAEGVPVYGIAWRDRPANARAFLAELGDPYAGVMLDPDSRAAIALGVTGAPETFVIGADGRVALRWAGPLTEDVVERRIRPALERR
ncbi:MAG: DsbE family thiol:disulfide interchange protein [Maricaulaceae bacterium]|nr:DsbE family thiol:disulfide interchange protein [Maricaulaceae bacterium]